MTIWTGLFPKRGCLASCYDRFFFLEIPRCNADSVDRDQTPRSLVTDLGLRSLQLSVLWEARHKFKRD